MNAMGSPARSAIWIRALSPLSLTSSHHVVPRSTSVAPFFVTMGIEASSRESAGPSASVASRISISAGSCGWSRIRSIPEGASDSISTFRCHVTPRASRSSISAWRSLISRAPIGVNPCA